MARPAAACIMCRRQSRLAGLLELLSVAAKSEKVGVWLVGACGSVGCTVALGVAGKRRTSTLGLVTELPLFANLDLPAPGSFVIGGHEIRRETLTEAARALHERSGLFDRDLLRDCAPRLRRMQANIAPGTLIGTTSTTKSDCPSSV